MKLYVSLKRKTHLEEEDTYDWGEDKPYNIEQAFEALDEQPAPGTSPEHMAMLKIMNERINNANVHMSQALN